MNKLLYPQHPTQMQLSFFIDEELRPEDREYVATHIGICVRCRLKVGRLRRLGGWIRHIRNR